MAGIAPQGGPGGDVARDVPSANLAGESLAAAREAEKLKDEDDEELVDDDKDWDDWQEDEADMPTRCLITGNVCGSPEEALASTAQHGLKIREHLKGRNTYDRMKIVNFVRREAAAKRCVEEIDAEVAAKAWDDEAFIKPFLEDDPLLFALDAGSDSESERAEDDAATINALRDENRRLKEKIQQLLDERQVACPQCGFGAVECGKGIQARGYRGGKKGA